MNTQIFLKLLFAIILAVLAYYASALESGTRLIIGLILGIPSLALVITGRIQLGKAFAVMPAAKGLVTTGLYSKLRHPLYLFADLVFLAVFIIIGLPWLLVLWVVLVFIQAIQSRREEKFLADAYGAEYENYKAHTWF
jgi:protein-S-isoprenylcysteine O-methyltransferase Ste14